VKSVFTSEKSLDIRFGSNEDASMLLGYSKSGTTGKIKFHTSPYPPQSALSPKINSIFC